MDKASILATLSERSLLASNVVPETAAEVRIAYNRKFFRLLDRWMFEKYDIVHQTLEKMIKYSEQKLLFAYTFSSYASTRCDLDIEHLRAYLATDLPLCRAPSFGRWSPLRIAIIEVLIESERGIRWGIYNRFEVPAEYKENLDSDKIRNYYNQIAIEKQNFDKLIPLHHNSRENAKLGLRYGVRHMLFDVSLFDVVGAYGSERNSRATVVRFLNTNSFSIQEKCSAILHHSEIGETFFFDFYNTLVVEFTEFTWFREFTSYFNPPLSILDKLGFKIDWKSLPYYFEHCFDPKLYERYRAPQVYSMYREKLTQEILIDHLRRGFPLFTFRYTPEHYNKLLQTKSVRRALSILQTNEFDWRVYNFHLFGPKFIKMMITVCQLRSIGKNPWWVMPNELLFQIFNFAI